MGLWAMDATKPYKFIGFGAMDVTKPYKFIGFGAMEATKPYEFIKFGAMEVTKPYEFIGFGAIHVTKLYKIYRVWGQVRFSSYGRALLQVICLPTGVAVLGAGRNNHGNLRVF